MSWSYSSSSLGLSKNKVRLFIGDTDSAREQLADEEISYVLTVETSPTLAAASCCDLLAAKYSFMCNTENGALKVSAAARMQHYIDLADRLRKGGAGEIPGDAVVVAATMYVGGSSVAAKEAIYADTDNVSTPFQIGQDDHSENPQTRETLVDPWDPVD